jgi:hypothetical protein
MTLPTGNLSVVSPAEYKISVVGFLDESLSDHFCGLSINNFTPGQNDGKHVAILTGRLADQAALFGVLNALYDMRMPLISVECRNVDEPKGE